MPISLDDFDKLPKMRIHKSMITLYKKCPMSFKLAWLDEAESIDAPEATIGSLFHEFAKNFFDYITIPIEGDVLEYFMRYLPERPLELRRLCKFFLKFEAERYITLAKQNLLDYYLPYAREVFLSSEKSLFEGTIDRIDKNPDGTFTVIEYKTGAWRLSDFRRELAIYTILVEEHIGPVKYVVVINPNLERYIVEEPKESSRRAAVTWRNRILKALLEDKFSPKSGDHCLWCLYRHVCPVWREKVE